MNIIELAKQAGAMADHMTWVERDLLPVFERFAALVEAAARADEREECAKVVDAIEARCVAKDVDDPPLAHVAAAIRARGTT